MILYMVVSLLENSGQKLDLGCTEPQLFIMLIMTGREMLYEKNKEIEGMNKEFQRQIQILVEDHKKEVDVSIGAN